MTLIEAAMVALRLVYHQDHANAAMHVGTVRYSPLTFRLAEVIIEDDDFVAGLGGEDMHVLHQVITDKGAYAEDPGR